ncbi:MAG: DUF4105 domain-containing protein [Paracoccaceae bacterium]
MVQLLKVIFIATIVLLIIALTAWGTLALWFRAPGQDTLRIILASAFALLGLTTMAAQFGRRPARSIAVFAFAFTAIVIWWSSIQPPNEGHWAADVARQVTGVIDGDIMTLNNVREFEWHSENDATENWTTRTYDLSQVQSTDLFMSYWDGPNIAHFILSFGFEGGEYLAWSIEVRRQVGGGFSPIADFFKENTMVIVASEEQDVVGVRSNIRGEDVRIFRVVTAPELRRHLIEELVNNSNALSEQPRFFNSLTSNCATTVVGMLRDIDVDIPFDWRLVVNGYLPDLIYDRGALDTRLPMSELRERGKIKSRAQAVGLNNGYSDAIRIGVPDPNT